MPNINFNAPVIRLGTSGPPRDAPSGGRHRDSNAETGGNRRGLGMNQSLDQQRQQVRDNMATSYIPPTREEIARTIFVGNISDGVGGDVGIERILRSSGGLRRWTRAIDSENKPCKFGFAEFDDAQSLETAAEVLKDVVVPLKRPQPKSKKTPNGEAKAIAEPKQKDAQTEIKDHDADAEQKNLETDKEGTDGEAGGAEVEVEDPATEEKEDEEVERTTLLVCCILLVLAH
jgi:hypothetical protein